MHVVKEVTVERPVAERIGGEIEGRSPTRLDEHGVLAWRPVALAGDQFEEMTVQVDRVAHRRIVDEVHPHPRSADRRLGNESVRTWTSRWLPSPSKKTPT